MSETIGAGMFSGLSRLAQSVFGYATIASIQSPRGEASISRLKSDMGLTDEEWETALAELCDAGVARLTGEDLDNLDMVQTEATHALCMAALAPTNRPKAKDWAALRVRVFEYQFGQWGLEPHCVYCGAEGVPLALDHMLPLCRGGSNHVLNLIPACKPCNSSKGGKIPREWRGAR